MPYSWGLMPLKAAEYAIGWDYDHFHDTKLNDSYKNAFHALALTDHMAPFTACLWERHPGNSTNLEQCWFPGGHLVRLLSNSLVLTLSLPIRCDNGWLGVSLRFRG